MCLIFPRNLEELKINLNEGLTYNIQINNST